MTVTQVVELAELCDIRSGGTPHRSNAEYYGGEIPWAKISDLNSVDGIVQNTEETITEQGLQAIRGRLFEPGTLLFAIYGSIGSMAFAGKQMSTNQAILGISIRETKRLDGRFLYQYLSAKIKKFQSDGQGIAQKNLSAAYIRELRIHLPPLGEQRRIAAILDKADALRRKRKRTLQLASEFREDLYKANFVHARQSSWPTVSVGEISNDARTGPFGSQLLHSEFVESGIPVLGIDNVVSNQFLWGERRYISKQKFEQLRRYTVRPKDVLITIMGTCGRCAVVPSDIQTAINTKHLCCISLNQAVCLPEFLHATFLGHPDVLKQLGVEAKGAVMPGLNMGIIKKLTFPLPPMREQEAFVRGLAVLGSVSNRAKHGIELLDRLFVSLQSGAFSGSL